MRYGTFRAWIRKREQGANLRSVRRIVREREVEAELQGDRDSLFADREFVERWIGAKCGDRQRTTPTEDRISTL